ncbi:putative outer membrane repeat protein [Methanofollis sp. W23]|uniref:right-handed parallel beta-helix repeat-containing protein n=1 Tax=Methanofollis sp. W23 TaxID=2817849 RepID=UPI001AE7078C|nr:right-handed parallel beta-helix repeat-containing protein [Methanofollis sp. W23]MBP2146233.1 putative outer membrane repeat protein [Methanofollis sp. W23]
MNTVLSSGKKGVISLVLLAALIILVHPVAAGEEGAGPPETYSPEACPSPLPLENFTHPRDWYISATGTGNYTTLHEIPEIGAGDTIHLWGVENHTYDGGIAIDAPDVTVTRWEGSPVQPLVTSAGNTTPAFTVTADHATFLDLDISGNRLNYDNSRGAGINAAGDPGAPLRGLTIIDCTFAGNAVEGNTTRGGALYTEYVDDLQVERTAFRGNFVAGGPGGGVYIWRCENATFTDTGFISNRAMAPYGGGAYFNESRNAAFTNVTFFDNYVWGCAGGARFEHCDAATFTDTVFIDNEALSNCGGAEFEDCDALALTDTSFTGNEAWGSAGGARFWKCHNTTLTGTTVTGNTATKWYGGGVDFSFCENVTVAATTFTANSARYGGGIYFAGCENATVTTTSFIDNTAQLGGGAYFRWCDAPVLITSTTFTNNTAREAGGGAGFEECTDVMLADCRLDNPTNLYAETSAGVLNTTRTPGTNIAGGPYLGGNLWLRDPAQNISEWGIDADGDGICDLPLAIDGFGTDYLPLVSAP